jgi:uncharacterized protein (DUF736 family)
VAAIGQLTEDRGAFTGRIRTLSHRLAIELEPVDEKRGDQSPDFTVYAREGGELIPLGSAWKKTAERRGEPPVKFLSMTLDDPGFPAPLNIAAFPTDAGGWEIVWNRPRAANRDAA